MGDSGNQTVEKTSQKIKELDLNEHDAIKANGSVRNLFCMFFVAYSL